MSAPNVVTNSGFEDALAGTWTVTGDGTGTRVVDKFYAGLASLKLTNAAPTDNTYVKQTIAVADCDLGKFARVSSRIWGHTDMASGVRAKVWYEYFKSGVSLGVEQTAIAAQAASSSVWGYWLEPWSAIPLETTDIVVTCALVGGIGTCWFDDVILLVGDVVAHHMIAEPPYRHTIYAGQEPTVRVRSAISALDPGIYVLSQDLQLDAVTLKRKSIQPAAAPVSSIVAPTFDVEILEAGQVAASDKTLFSGVAGGDSVDNNANATYIRTGAASIKVICNGSIAGQGVCLATGHTIGVTPGYIYRDGIYAKGVTGTERVRARITQYDVLNAMVGDHTFGDVKTLSNSAFTEFELGATILTGVDHVNILLVGPSTEIQTMTFYVDDLSCMAKSQAGTSTKSIVDVEFDVSGYSEDDYTILPTLRLLTDMSVVSESGIIYEPENQDYTFAISGDSLPRVYVNKDRNLVVDRVETYIQAVNFARVVSPVLTPEEYRDLVADSALPVMMYGDIWTDTDAVITTFLDSCEAAGVKVIFGIKDIGGSGTPAEQAAAAVLKVAAHKGHDAVIGWFLFDELGIYRYPDIKAIYDAVKAEDPDHPCMAILLNLHSEWETALDLFIIDWYPVLWAAYYRYMGWWTWSLPVAYWTYGEYLQDAADAFMDSRPVWGMPDMGRMAVAGIDPNTIKWLIGDLVTWNYYAAPTYAEMLNYAYQSIVYGTKAMVWFSLQHMYLWDGLTQWAWVKEVAEASHDLAGLFLADASTIDAASSNAKVACVAKVYNGDTIIVGVNMSASPQTATITWGTTTISETIEGFGVRIWTAALGTTDGVEGPTVEDAISDLRATMNDTDTDDTGTGGNFTDSELIRFLNTGRRETQVATKCFKATQTVALSAGDAEYPLGNIFEPFDAQMNGAQLPVTKAAGAGVKRAGWLSESEGTPEAMMLWSGRTFRVRPTPALPGVVTVAGFAVSDDLVSLSDIIEGIPAGLGYTAILARAEAEARKARITKSYNSELYQVAMKLWTAWCGQMISVEDGGK